MPVIFDLFHTLIDGADDERDRVVAEMARMVGVAPADLVASYHATWRDRLVRWDVEETVRILARRLGANPSAEQVVGDGADDELAGATAVGMTVFRTTEHNDTHPGWEGPSLATIAHLPSLLPPFGRGGEPLRRFTPIYKSLTGCPSTVRPSSSAARCSILC